MTPTDTTAPRTHSPSLVVTDLAGTTVEDPGLVLAAFRAGLSAVHLGGVSDARLVELMGVDKREAFAWLLQRDRYDASVERALEVFVDHTVSDAEAGRYAPLPGVEVGLDMLHAAGARIAFTTGFGREILDTIIAANSWQRFDDGSVASDEVPHGRPAPDLVMEAMRRTAVREPSEVAVVGDTLSDLGCAEAARAGWAIAVTTGSGQREQLEAIPGAIVVDSFYEVVDTLLAGRSSVRITTGPVA